MDDKDAQKRVETAVANAREILTPAAAHLRESFGEFFGQLRRAGEVFVAALEQEIPSDPRDTSKPRVFTLDGPEPPADVIALRGEVASNLPVFASSRVWMYLLRMEPPYDGAPSLWQWSETLVPTPGRALPWSQIGNHLAATSYLTEVISDATGDGGTT